MTMHLWREMSTEQATMGELFLDSRFFCYTLEDPVRVVKIPGITAIPKGLYAVTINEMSHRFGRFMPRLKAVPGFEGVLIHPGNTSKDTEGCILVGIGRSTDHEKLFYSMTAFNSLFSILQGMKSPPFIQIHSSGETAIHVASRVNTASLGSI